MAFRPGAEAISAMGSPSPSPGTARRCKDRSRGCMPRHTFPTETTYCSAIPINGPDATPYLSTGTSSVTLTLPGQEKYVGLLWGSVDGYNTLRLYNRSTLVGTITGSDATSSANGNQGALGT